MAVIYGKDAEAEYGPIKRLYKEQLASISEHEPVEAGDLISKKATEDLIIMGFVYRDDKERYCLTAKGRIYSRS